MNGNRWERSSYGMLLGVARGFSDWTGVPVFLVRIGFVIIALATNVAPALIAYFALALLLPEERREEEYSKRKDEMNRKYESLKRKVEKMEDNLFNKERQWDEHFRAACSR